MCQILILPPNLHPPLGMPTACPPPSLECLPPTSSLPSPCHPLPYPQCTVSAQLIQPPFSRARGSLGRPMNIPAPANLSSEWCKKCFMALWRHSWAGARNLRQLKCQDCTYNFTHIWYMDKISWDKEPRQRKILTIFSYQWIY